MGEFGFGQKIGMLTDLNLNFVLEVLRAYSWRMGVYEQYPQLNNLQLEALASLLQYGTELGRMWEKWSATLSSTILDRENGKSKGRFSIVLESQDPSTKKSPPMQELLADGCFLMLAGK